MLLRNEQNDGVWVTVMENFSKMVSEVIAPEPDHLHDGFLTIEKGSVY